MANLDHLFNYSNFKGIIAFTKKIWAKSNDLILNIDTMEATDDGSVPNSKYHDGINYQSPDYWNLRKVANILKPRLSSSDVFYDLGSGKGRIMCFMARKPIKRVVGIELSEYLCEIAKQNADNLRGKNAEIIIECKDVVQADLSDGTIYFMYNPFGSDTMKVVINKIENSLLINPREITIVYYNSVHEYILSLCKSLQMYHFFNTATGRRVSFWRNTNNLSGNSLSREEMFR